MICQEIMQRYVMIRTIYTTLMEIYVVEIGRKKQNFANQHMRNRNLRVAN